MVRGPYHHKHITIKQSWGIENTLLEHNNVIDFPVKSPNLSAYDEAMEVE